MLRPPAMSGERRVGTLVASCVAQSVFEHGLSEARGDMCGGSEPGHTPLLTRSQRNTNECYKMI